MSRLSVDDYKILLFSYIGIVSLKLILRLSPVYQGANSSEGLSSILILLAMIGGILLLVAFQYRRTKLASLLSSALGIGHIAFAVFYAEIHVENYMEYGRSAVHIVVGLLFLAMRRNSSRVSVSNN